MIDVLTRYPVVGKAFLVALVVSLVLTPVVGLIARRLGAVDRPDDERRVHREPTPRLGGLAVMVGTIVAAVMYIQWDAPPGLPRQALDQMVVTLTGAACAAMIGAVDDLLSLRWRAKLAGEVLVAMLAIFAPLAGSHTDSADQLALVVRTLDLPFLHPYHLPLAVGVFLSALWIVTMMNVVNFIDGVDGLAAGTCAITAATFAVIAASYGRVNVAVVAAASCGAAIGFLRDNFRKGGARIFLGDAGSMLLGYLLAVVTIQGVLKTTAAISLVIPLTLLAVPLFDTAFVVAKRMKYKISVASADRWHLHHRLLNVGYRPRQVAVSFWVWTASMSAVALALRFVDYGNSRHWRMEGVLQLGSIASIAVFVSLYFATRLEIIKTRGVRERNRETAAAAAAASAAAADDSTPAVGDQSGGTGNPAIG